MKTGNLLLDLSFQFSLDIIEYTELLEEKRRFVVSNQLAKSGTSIGANAREAQNAESKKDFVHKLKIAAKEADETEYWLLLCKHSKNNPETGKLLDSIGSLKRILGKIIVSSRN